MKKISLTIFAVLLVSCMLFYPLSSMCKVYASDEEYSPFSNYKQGNLGTPETAYTLKGTPYTVYRRPTNTLNANDYAEIAKSELRYPNAVKLRAATDQYTCFSYISYSQVANNDIYVGSNWTVNITDGSYSEITNFFEVQPGDIVLYYNVSMSVCVHAGIVEQVLEGTSESNCRNSDLITVVSKWGVAGLYRHRGDQCPYLTENIPLARRLKFYRHFHEADSYTATGSLDYHLENCYCGHSEEAAHSWLPRINGFVCGSCGERTTGIPVPFENLPATVQSMATALEDGMSIRINDDMQLYYDGENYYVLVPYGTDTTQPIVIPEVVA